MRASRIVTGMATGVGAMGWSAATIALAVLIDRTTESPWSYLAWGFLALPQVILLILAAALFRRYRRLRDRLALRDLWMEESVAYGGLVLAHRMEMPIAMYKRMLEERTHALLTREVLRRTPHLDLSTDPPLDLMQSFEVAVFVDRQQWKEGETGEHVEVALAPLESAIDLHVWLVASPDHFRVVGSEIQTITVERDKDRSTTAVFQLVAAASEPPCPEGIISALFAHNGRACGRVSRMVLLLPAGVSKASPSPPVDTASNHDGVNSGVYGVQRGAVAVDWGRPADLNIRIVASSPDARRFECHVQTHLLAEYSEGRTGPWELKDTVRSWVLDKMEDFTQAGSNAKYRRLALLGAGMALFEGSPPVFRDAFWNLIDSEQRFKTISIVSDEPYVPWELMVPVRSHESGDSEERDPLGIEFSVGRWTSREHVHPPQEIELDACYVLAPKDSKLSHAEQEAALVLALVGGERIDPATIEQLDYSLARHGTSLLHVICHGLSDQGEQVLELEGGELLKSYLIAPLSGVRQAFRACRPFVFLNACEVGRLEPSIVGTGGFAEAFMALHASAVVAPLWAVEDHLAHEVAKLFYERVTGQPKIRFAEIMREIRQKAYLDAHGEDTWAAYCFYGDPLASVVRSVFRESE